MASFGVMEIGGAPRVQTYLVERGSDCDVDDLYNGDPIFNDVSDRHDSFHSIEYSRKVSLWQLNSMLRNGSRTIGGGRKRKVATEEYSYEEDDESEPINVNNFVFLGFNRGKNSLGQKNHGDWDTANTTLGIAWGGGMIDGVANIWRCGKSTMIGFAIADFFESELGIEVDEEETSRRSVKQVVPVVRRISQDKKIEWYCPIYPEKGLIDYSLRIIGFVQKMSREIPNVNLVKKGLYDRFSWLELSGVQPTQSGGYLFPNSFSMQIAMNSFQSLMIFQKLANNQSELEDVEESDDF